MGAMAGLSPSLDPPLRLSSSRCAAGCGRSIHWQTPIRFMSDRVRLMATTRIDCGQRHVTFDRRHEIWNNFVWLYFITIVGQIQFGTFQSNPYTDLVAYDLLANYSVALIWNPLWLLILCLLSVCDCVTLSLFVREVHHYMRYSVTGR